MFQSIWTFFFCYFFSRRRCRCICVFVVWCDRARVEKMQFRNFTTHWNSFEPNKKNICKNGLNITHKKEERKNLNPVNRWSERKCSALKARGAFLGMITMKSLNMEHNWNDIFLFCCCCCSVLFQIHWHIFDFPHRQAHKSKMFVGISWVFFYIWVFRRCSLCFRVPGSFICSSNAIYENTRGSLFDENGRKYAWIKKKRS